jgi:4-hydroxymandelate oxidase
MRATSRRRFLHYLAASPVFAASAWPADAADAALKLPDPMVWAPQGLEPIKSPKEAIKVFDFEPVAFKNVPAAHFGDMASGLDDEVTLRANREGFLKLQLRPRRLNDVSKVDMSVEIFGTAYDSPIFVCSTGGNQFFHEEGELAVARAARAGNHLQVLSTSSNFSVGDVTKARGAPIWFQLYASPSWDVARALIKKADAAGCPVLAVTVDRVAGRNQETLFRLMKSDTRDCSACHDRSSFAARAARRPQLRWNRSHPDCGTRRVQQFDLGHDQAHARCHDDEDRAQGYRHGRGCRAFGQERHRWHPGFQSRWSRRGQRPLHDRCAAGDCGRGQRSNPGFH